MEASVGAAVEVPVESNGADPPDRRGALDVRLLGPMSIRRAGVALALPASRKVRALFAWLALAAQPVARARLCEWLWDVPNDPRGELRWCLSKIRGLVDEPGHRRVHAEDDTIRLDLRDCFVDAIEVDRAADEGFASLAPARRRALCALFGGDFIEGLELERSPSFAAWTTAQRRHFRGCHAALLEQLAGSAGNDEAFAYLERWLQLAPFDPRVHERLLAALVRAGRVRDAEEHLATTERAFEAEGLDRRPLRDAWRSARSRGTDASIFVEPAPGAQPAIAPAAQAGVDPRTARRASIAVMPFVDRFAEGGPSAGIGDALAHDVITRLAKLRSLFVIAQGTVFALHERGVGTQEAGRMLDVDYVFGGSVRRASDRLTVAVELAEARSARIVWTETFEHAFDDAFAVLDEIGNRIVASIDHEVEALERNRAVLLPPNSLDAWSAHHRGLWHMYRFDRPDNERARAFFETAVRLDPTFSRAWAGLSFTHFQDAFQGWTERAPATERAFEAAAQGLMVDERDPAAHWAMGRALWLRGGHDASVAELEQAVDLSPNFALGHYTLSFVHSQAGDPHAAIASADHSRHLSPFDPLLFGMLGARAMALVRLGEFAEAASWAVRAAARPNAHPHILAIAAFTLALAGSLDEAGAYAAAIRRVLPRYGIADFLAAFRFDTGGAETFREGARRIGMA